MPEESELVGGISAELRADHSKLPGDIAEAEKLVQQWAKQYTAELRINMPGAGTGGGPQRQQQRQTVVEDLRREEAQRVQSVQRVVQAESTARRAARRATPTADSGEEEGRLGFQTRMAAFEMREEERAFARVQQTRVSRGQKAFAESERQRRTELNATRKHYDSLATLAEQHFDEQANRLESPEAQNLRQLSYEAQREQRNVSPGVGGAGAGFAGRNRTPAEQEAFRREERARAATMANAPTRAGRPGITTVVAEPAARPVDAIERARQSALARLEGRPRGGAGGANALGVEDFERRAEQRIAASEAARVAAGRTARTTAAGFGGQFLFGGPARQQIEAVSRQTEAEQKLLAARRRLNDPTIIRDARAYRAAVEEQVVAEKELAGATERVVNLSSGGTALRSLAAVTVAGAAFGLAMQGVGVAVDLVGKAISPTLERLTGFATTTAKYTDELSEATRQASGNAQAVTSLKLAQTGLSSTTAASIQPLIQQRAEIEAGNKAIRDQIEAFRVSENLRKQGGGAGLGTTTGGFLGTPLLGIPSTGEQIGNLLGQLGAETRTRRGGGQVVQPSQTELVEAQNAFARGLATVNEQLEKGGGRANTFAQAADKTDARIEATARAFDELSPPMAAAIRTNGLYADSIRDVEAATKALQAINIAGLLPDPELLAQQFNRQRFALINQAERQQQYAINTQLPAQQALQNLAQPLKPVGTGYVARNAEEQDRIADSQKRSIELQDQLNERYERGVDILENTYKVPPQLLNNIRAVGEEIAGLQASIANQQAAYQVAQYNYQLTIAKRTLADIGGLTGKDFGAGQSYLGQLEKENLALSRQGQLLQFNLAQRQINFQKAIAGFVVPGLTGEERAARIKQANIEADFAQRQLDIGKGVFENQVKIVDIQNLRQGADLVRQIALLEQGRQITLDVQVKTEEIERLIRLQEQQVAEVGTYLTEIDSLANAAFSEIQQLELATGRAVQFVAQRVLEQFGLALNGINNELEEFTERQNGPPGYGGHAPGRGPVENEFASGVLGRATSPTDITVGDAGGEEVAVLRNPRAHLGSGSGIGSAPIIINITGNNVRSDDDLRNLARIVEETIKSLGTRASLQGLRPS